MILSEKKKSITKVIAHVLVWGILLTIPLLSASGDTMQLQYVAKTWIPMFLMTIVFYLNYFWLIDKYLFGNKVVMFIISNIFLAFLCFLFSEWLIHLCCPRLMVIPANSPPFLIKKPLMPGGSGFKIRTFLFFILTAGTSVAIRSTQKWLLAETERKNLENEKLKSELSHLRYQIQPHFFFNSLNNIYALVDSAPNKAKESIHGLSKLMRHVLYETTADKIPLSQEITFLRNFVKLMEIRLTSSVTLNVSFPNNYSEHQIAPLLLVPLVENAFKHGVSASQMTLINIKMEVEDGRLNFWVENTWISKPSEDTSESGIGLQNLKKRLELLYPNTHELKTEIKGNMYLTKLTIVL
jgi:hypothetical protein